eukprot:scaffold2295_cov354-Prasinococcus_capsulatus_cf.AAC.19
MSLGQLTRRGSDDRRDAWAASVAQERSPAPLRAQTGALGGERLGRRRRRRQRTPPPVAREFASINSGHHRYRRHRVHKRSRPQLGCHYQRGRAAGQAERGVREGLSKARWPLRPTGGTGDAGTWPRVPLVLGVDVAIAVYVPCPRVQACKSLLHHRAVAIFLTPSGMGGPLAHGTVRHCASFRRALAPAPRPVA